MFEKMRVQNERLKKQLALTKNTAKAGGKKAVVAAKHATASKVAQAKTAAALKAKKIADREKAKQVQKYNKQHVKMQRSIAKDVAKNMKAIGNAKRAVATKKAVATARKQQQVAKRQGLSITPLPENGPGCYLIGFADDE
jgi:hypothetical protein